MLSVVIPLYNKAHTIERTLNTVLNQSFSNFEVIIVNDGSTDNGTEVISNFTKDSRIRIIDQKNQGVSVARNNGVKEATFEYIAFLDGDDEWQPDYLQTVYKAITQYPEAGMFCTAGIVRTGNHVGLRLAKKYKGKILSVDFFENPHVFVHTSATVVKKEVFYKTLGFPESMKRNEDYALFFCIALLSQVIYIGKPLSIYVGNVEGQATNTPFEQVYKHVVNRYLIVHDCWAKQSTNRKTYPIFTRYELRHTLMVLIQQNKYEFLNKLLDELYIIVNQFFSQTEQALLRNQSLKPLALFYIKLTKARWRIRNYPRLDLK